MSDHAASTIRLVESFAMTSNVLTEEVIGHLSDSGLRDVAYMLAKVQIGLSSAGMVRWAIRSPNSDEYIGNLPRDTDDIRRCERVYENSPPWLQGRMLPVLEAFRAHVAAS